MTESQPEPATVNRDELTRRLGALADVPGLDDALLARIGNWLTEGPENELFRINLIAWASDWQVPREVAISHFLHLVSAGIATMYWEIHCTRCNAVLERHERLQEVHAEHDCPACRTSVTIRLDDHIEVTFGVHPAIRQVSGSVPYEPGDNVRYISIHQLAAGAAQVADIDVPAELSEMRIITAPPYRVDVRPVVGFAPESRIAFPGGEALELPASIARGKSRLQLENASDHPRLVALEDEHIDEYRPDEVGGRLSGFEVVSSPAFRRLFKAETLADLEGLQVRDVTLVFTDIQGSSAIYRELGDLQAYRQVREHFQLLFTAIRDGGGTVIKTMGDSVLATFPNPLKAVHTALHTTERMRDATGVTIRAAIHRGPALAVTLNDRLDFFGTTVNTTARMESECGSDELCVSDGILDAAGVREALDSYRVEARTVRLRGFSGVFTINSVKRGD